VANTRPRIPATLPPQAYGRGLSNVALRLRVAYGDAAQLSLDPGSSGGTVATLLLPLRRGAAFRELPA
jgi:sensor histidine kinase YesM